MKRDMELVRQILLEIEKRSWEDSRRPLQIEGRSDEEVAYHLRLLDEAGLIEGHDTSTFSGPGYMPGPLTWEGHDFLDAARSDSRWKTVMGKVSEKVGTATFDIIKQLLVGLAKDQLGI